MVEDGLEFLRRGFTYSRNDFTELSILADAGIGMGVELEG